MPFVSRVLVCARAYHTTFLCGLCAGFVEGGVVCVPTSLLEELRVDVYLSSLNNHVSTTVLPLSIMESTKLLCTESSARDTSRHSVDFSFSASLRYETGE